AEGHTLPNANANANRLFTIFWDPNLSRTEKLDEIINELMTPNGIDGLIAVQFKQGRDDEVTLRPVVISRSTKNIYTMSVALKKEVLDCRDPTLQKRVLCVDNFLKATRRLWQPWCHSLDYTGPGLCPE